MHCTHARDTATGHACMTHGASRRRRHGQRTYASLDPSWPGLFWRDRLPVLLETSLLATPNFGFSRGSARFPWSSSTGPTRRSQPQGGATQAGHRKGPWASWNLSRRTRWQLPCPIILLAQKFSPNSTSEPMSKCLHTNFDSKID